MNILVTGCNGQLGTEVKNRANGGNYFFTDVQELDITNEEAVDAFVSEKKINVIVNCAAYTNVDKAESDRDMAMKINCEAVRILGSVAKKYSATVIHISTDYVFDGRGFEPYKPSDTTKPQSVYGATKLAGEIALKATKCNAIIFRTAWLYSPYGKNFVKTMINLTRDKDELKVVVDQVGSPTYAGDLAELIVKIISENMLDKVGTYHFSNQGVCSWYDFTIAIRDIAGQQCNVRPCSSEEFPSPVKRPHYSVLDKSLTEETFNYRIPYWRDSLTECMKRM